MSKLTKAILWISVSALFLIPLYALVFDTAFFVPFVTTKAIYFRVLVEITFVGWTFLAVVDQKYRVKFSTTTIVVTVFAVVALEPILIGDIL